jgi:hypothetical protein
MEEVYFIQDIESQIVSEIERGEIVVELDQFKYTLNSYTQPLIEVRDSL